MLSPRIADANHSQLNKKLPDSVSLLCNQEDTSPPGNEVIRLVCDTGFKRKEEEGAAYKTFDKQL